MVTKKEKRKMCVLVNENTYNNVFDFIQNNDLRTARLVPGLIVEMSLHLFFKEVSQRPLEDIAVEFLMGDG